MKINQTVVLVIVAVSWKALSFYLVDIWFKFVKHLEKKFQIEKTLFISQLLQGSFASLLFSFLNLAYLLKL